MNHIVKMNQTNQNQQESYGQLCYGGWLNISTKPFNWIGAYKGLGTRFCSWALWIKSMNLKAQDDLQEASW